MEGNQCADNTVDQPLSAEYKIENRGETAQNPEQSASRKGLLVEVHKIGATRLAGFLYWTNIAVIVFLTVGFVAPGWFTFKTEHKMYKTRLYSYGSSSDNNYKSVYVYQDYALFYMTQCSEYRDYTNDVYYQTCETMTYRTINHLYKDNNYDYSKIIIGEKEITGDDRCTFRGAGLVMSISKVTRLQALYTAGLLLTIFTFFIWHGYRSELAKGNFTSFSRLRWLIMFTVSAISVIILFVPVVSFAVVRGEVFPSRNNDNVETSLGSVFAGFGAGFMALKTIIVFMQLICCRSPGTYICSCTDELGTSAPAGVV